MVALATLNLWTWRKFSQERATTAELRAALAEWQKSTSAAPARDRAEVARVEVSAAPARPAEAAPFVATPPPGSESQKAMRAWQERERRMMRDPEYRNARLDAARQELSQTRADAIRVVGMTAEQADRVIDLWVDRNLWFAEHADMANSGRLNGEAQAEMQRRSEAEQAEIRSLLGEEKYAAWTHYLQTGSERGEVNHFNSQLAAASAQMSPAIADRLVEVMYVEHQRSQEEQREFRRAARAAGTYEAQSREVRERWLESLRAANRRVHAAMSDSLTPAQLERLDAMLAMRLVPLEAALRVDAE
jgi:hypothetical protein